MGDGQRDGSRTVSAVAGIALLAAGAFGYGLWSGATGGWAYRTVMSLLDTAGLALSEVPNLVGSEPVDFLQPARHAGQGVTLNVVADDRLIAIAGFFDGQNGIRLMRRDGTLVAAWTLQFSRDFPETAYLEDRAPQTDWNVDLHGLVVNPDGSVVVNYEYAGLIKLDRCGRREWTLEHATHHSVEKAEGGGYWVPGLRLLHPGRMEDAFPPFTDMKGVPYILDNLILKVSEDGEITQAKSVPRILFDNGMEPILTANGMSFFATGRWNDEIVHMNKIAELPAAMAAAFPQFAPGDLLLSLREQNMLLVVSPGDWRVKWHQVGPWRRQHDPEFMPDGTIALFNNNAYRTLLGERDTSPVDGPFVSEIGRVDPRTGAYEDLWGNRPGQAMLSVIRGKQEPLASGGFLVTEFEAGRAFETDADGMIVWEYVNHYDGTRVAEITEARSYPASYFTVTDWSCPAP